MKEIKGVQDNKLMMIKVTNQGRVTTNTVTPNNKVVLMQTATVVVNSKWNNYNRVKCRLLFDSGIQRT